LKHTNNRNMKKYFTKFARLLALFLLLAAAKSYAQPGIGLPYSFAVNTVSVLPTSGYSTNIAVALANQNDWATAVYAPAGFNFPFGGVNYTGFFLSTNGWLALTNGLANGTATPAAYVGGLPANQLSNNTGGWPIIAPLWDDLSVSGMQWVYTAPVLTVRWFNVKWQAANAATTSFGVKLNTTTGDITILHPNAAYTPSTPSASIGIAGCPGDFYSVSAQTATTATASNLIENTSIGTGSANNFRPQNVEYTFTPAAPIHDNCAGAVSLGSITATCTNTLSAAVHATASPYGVICSTADDKDVWYSFTKPIGIGTVIITTSAATCASLTGTSIEVFSGNCAGLTSIGCATTNIANSNSFGEVSVARNACISEVLYVRVAGDGNTAGKFNICARDGSSTGATCANASIICSIPYSQTNLTTCGYGNDYDSTSMVCHTVAGNGEDYLFAYTPTVNQCIRVSVTSSGSDPSVFITNGCPNSAGANCLFGGSDPSGTIVINSVALTAGVTYYIMVDNVSTGGCIPFDIAITSVGTANAYDACASAVNLGSVGLGVNCVFQTYSTECSTPSPTTGYPVPTCATTAGPPFPPAFVNGVTGDVWLTFTAGFTGSLLINTQQSSSNPIGNAGMAVYTGACGALTQYACDVNSGPNGMPSLSIPVTNGTVYRIRIWTENPENTGNFDICFQSACAPPNDLPCQAVAVPLGGTITGVNSCSGSASEPVNSAQCAAGGTINTVWYYVIVPATGTVRIRTHPLTLTDTQIQAFSFPTGCGNALASNISRGCNDDGPPCSGGYNDFSELQVTGLTPGETLYVAVDGFGSLTGSFEITVTDGSTFPAVPQQDCAGATVICSTNDIVVADPGYRNYGNICDMPSAFSCWGVGERNSVWYQFTVDPALSGGTATVAFDVLTAASTDIDIMVWDITGLSNYCTSIASNSLPSAACNYCAASASTGLGAGGGCYAPAITFSGAPRTYLLLLNNWNSSPSAGFTLDWGTTPIASTTSTAIWDGTSNNQYSTTTNWGACGATPSCSVDATVNSTSNGNQPNVVGVQSVKNITINAGATLTMAAGSTLNVCGNFTNFGTLNCGAGSTVNFIGNTNATITGNLTGTNGFANLTISKLPGSTVTLANNIDVKENFNESTGAFSINGKYMKVAGNFTNSNGTTSFTGFAASTVEFNGTANQNFTNSAGSITLNRVVMNKTGGKLFLTGASSTMNIDTALTLTLGIIDTRSIAALEVNMRNNSTTAITAHNNLSYIDGKLRRKIYAGAALAMPFSLDFPVGDALAIQPGATCNSGYNLGNITFTTSTLISDLLSWFTRWPSQPPPVGPTASECLYATYDNPLAPLMNQGYWTFQRTSSAFNGNYNVALHNCGFSAPLGSGWTVTRADINANPMLQASWSLAGQCVISSTATNAQRINMNPAPVLAINSFNHLYATAQSIDPLPIELLYFTAEPKGDEVLCSWATSSETNNEYFEIERSIDNEEFISIGKVHGYGEGTSTQNRDYSLLDHEMCKELRYYRLKQVDINGDFQYSESVAVNCRQNRDEISVFPNPASTKITFQFYQQSEAPVLMRIIDVTGRSVKEQTLNTEKGFNTFYLDVDDLAKGVYYIQLKTNNQTDDNAIRQSRFFKN
jgi:hypothetical protein